MNDDRKSVGSGPLYGADQEVECEQELSESEVSNSQASSQPKGLPKQGSEPLRRRLKLADRAPRTGDQRAPVAPLKRCR